MRESLLDREGLPLGRVLVVVRQDQPPFARPVRAGSTSSSIMSTPCFSAASKLAERVAGLDPAKRTRTTPASVRGAPPRWPLRPTPSCADGRTVVFADLAESTSLGERLDPKRCAGS